MADRGRRPGWLEAAAGGVLLYLMASGLPYIVVRESHNGWSPRLSFSADVGESAAVMGVLVAIVISLHVALWEHNRRGDSRARLPAGFSARATSGATSLRVALDRKQGRTSSGRNNEEQRLLRLDALLAMAGWLAMCVGLAALMDAWPFQPLRWTHIGLLGAGILLFFVSHDRPERLWSMWQQKDRTIGRRRQRLWRAEASRFSFSPGSLLSWCLLVAGGLALLLFVTRACAAVPLAAYLVFATWTACLLWRLGRVEGWAYHVLAFFTGVVSALAWVGLFLVDLKRGEVALLVVAFLFAVGGVLGVAWGPMRDSTWTRGPLAELWSVHLAWRTRAPEAQREGAPHGTRTRK